jgi:hypothetical protein
MITTHSCARAVWPLFLLSSLACGGPKPLDLATAPPPPAAAPANANAPATQQEADRIRLLEEAQAREKAARKQRRDEMRAMGTATITKKKQLGSGKSVKLELDFEFKNVSKKELAVAEGALEIRDKSGELLKSLKVPFPGPIKPGASAKKTGKFPADPVKPTDITLVKTPLKELSLNWVPQHYRFTDGTDVLGE